MKKEKRENISPIFTCGSIPIRSLIVALWLSLIPVPVPSTLLRLALDV